MVHSLVTSAANVADMHMLPDLLHGEERKVWGDAGYQGTEAIRGRTEGPGHDLPQDEVQEIRGRVTKRKNRSKSSVRAKVEHPFRIVKRIFGSTR